MSKYPMHERRKVVGGKYPELFVRLVLREFTLKEPRESRDEFARRMGIGRTTLWGWLNRYGLPDGAEPVERTTQTAGANKARIYAASLRRKGVLK